MTMRIAKSRWASAPASVSGAAISTSALPTAEWRGYPEPASGPYAIVGRVFDASGGVPDASVNIWVQQARGGYSYVWANGRLTTNSAGEFIAPNLPEATLSFWAVSRPGFVQPRAVTVAVPSSGVVQVELVADATLAVLDAPRPLLVRGTVLAGTVFETEIGVRKPVAAAELWVSTECGVVVATTKTDVKGRFFLYNVPDRVLLYVGGTRFALRDVWLPDSTTVSPLEIEVQQQ